MSRTRIWVDPKGKEWVSEYAYVISKKRTWHKLSPRDLRKKLKKKCRERVLLMFPNREKIVMNDGTVFNSWQKAKKAGWNKQK